MRILPDIHYAKNFRKRYNENYEKIQSKITESAANRKPREKVDWNVVKYGLIGLGASALMIAALVGIGRIASHGHDAKEKEIASLKYEISDLTQQILTYEAINGDEMKEQVSNALAWVTYLQSQYLTGEFDENFDVYSARYLGDYNNDWSEGRELENPSWQGYINKAAGFDSEAELVFILYDGHMPVLLTNASFSLDRSGNLGAMTGVGKLWLI